MRSLRTATLALLISTLAFTLFAGTAFAQGEQGASVVILKFERFDVDDSVMTTFYETLESEIESHKDMHVKSGGEVTVKDLILTAGCSEPTPDCLSNLRDLVDADRIVFGKVQRSDDVFLFTARMFDFSEGRFVHEIADETVQGSRTKLERALPAVIEGFLHGTVGVLQVNVKGADAPEIFFDGEKMGLAPTKLENLPLGEHVVTVKTRDGEEKSRTVILRHDDPETANFVFGTATPPGDPEPVATGPSQVPGWVVIGLGVAGMGFGIYSSLEVIRSERDVLEIQDEYGVENSAFPPDTYQDAVANGDAQRHDERLEEGERFEWLQFVGYGVGAAGILVGSYLVYRATSWEPEGEQPTASRIDVGIAPTRDGVAGSLRLRF